MMSMPSMLLWNLISATILAAIILGLGRTRLLRPRPALRQTLWMLVLVKLVTPPLIPIRFIAQAEPTIVSSDVAGETSSRGPSQAIDETPPWQEAVVRSTETASQSGVLPILLGAMLLLWAGGTIGLIGLAVVYGRRFHRLVRLADPCPPWLQAETRELSTHLGLTAVPETKLVLAKISPVLWAWGRCARVVLPQKLVHSLSPAQLRVVLAHELAHFKRSDHWVSLSGFVICSLCWWFPVAWLARRAIRQAQDECCDRYVVSRQVSTAREYAEVLFAVVREFNTASPLFQVAPQMGASSVIRRFAMLRSSQVAYQLSRANKCGLGLLALILLCIPIVVDHPLIAAAPHQKTPQKKGVGASKKATVPSTFAEVQIEDQSKIRWGKPRHGLRVGIGQITTTLKSPALPFIEVYLENVGKRTIGDIIQSAARFVLELDGRYYVMGDYGGPVSRLAPGKRFGPIKMRSEHFHRTKKLEMASTIDQSTPRPLLTAGKHKLRVFFKLDEINVVGDLVPSAEVPFQVKVTPFPTMKAVAQIKKDLASTNRDVRREAALYAGKLGLAGYRVDLENCLASTDTRLRRYAAESLGKIGDRKAVVRLKQSLNEPDLGARYAVVESLVKLGEPLDRRWIEPIIRSRHRIFQNAIWLVRRNSGKQAATILADCVDQKDPSITSYYNYTLIWQIHACGGPEFKFHHDFDGRGSPEQVQHNKTVLAALKTWRSKQPK